MRRDLEIPSAGRRCTSQRALADTRCCAIRDVRPRRRDKKLRKPSNRRLSPWLSARSRHPDQALSVAVHRSSAPLTVMLDSRSHPEDKLVPTPRRLLETSPARLQISISHPFTPIIALAHISLGVSNLRFRRSVCRTTSSTHRSR
jgi:hypothetical protein